MPRRVLVVDDSATLRRIVRRMLEEGGYEVHTANDGAEGLEALQRDRFDLCLVDFVMPRLNGYQLTQALRSLPTVRDLPVILMSARAEQIGARFMSQTGAVASLPKPFPRELLLETVGKALGSASSVPTREVALPTPGAPRPTLVEGLAQTSREWLHIEREEPPLAPAAVAPSSFQDAGHYERIPRMTTRPPGALDAGPGLLIAAPRVAAPTPQDALQELVAGFQWRLAECLTPMVRDLSSTEGDLDTGAVLHALQLYLSGPQVLEMAQELQTMLDLSSAPSEALRGSLGLVPLGELFQLLHLQAQTGLLVVERAPGADEPRVLVAFREGRIDQCVGRGLGEAYLLGRYLVLEEVLSRAELEALARSRPADVLLGEHLVASGRVTPQALETALTQQSSELVYEILRWSAGRFRFEHRALLPMAQGARLGLPGETLTLEGFRRMDEWRLFTEVLPSDTTLLRRDEATVRALGAERLDRDERRILDAVERPKALQAIVDGSGMNPFDACKILYRLVRARFLVVEP